MLSGKKLQFLRIYKDINQTDVAKALRCTKNYISMLENEHQSIPQDLYERWVDFLNGKITKPVEEEIEGIEQEVKETEQVIKKTSRSRKTKSEKK